MDAYAYLEICKVPDKVLQAASDGGVPAEILAAVVRVESGGNTEAVRYEKNYKWLYKVRENARENRISVDTEEVLQKMSIGLFQVMGALARELGFRGSLINLTKPEEGSAWAVIHIARLGNKYNNWPDALSAYNQGTPRRHLFSGKYKNQKYVDKVMNEAKKFGYVFE